MEKISLMECHNIFISCYNCNIFWQNCTKLQYWACRITSPSLTIFLTRFVTSLLWLILTRFLAQTSIIFTSLAPNCNVFYNIFGPKLQHFFWELWILLLENFFLEKITHCPNPPPLLILLALVHQSWDTWRSVDIQVSGSPLIFTRFSSPLWSALLEVLFAFRQTVSFTRSFSLVLCIPPGICLLGLPPDCEHVPHHWLWFAGLGVAAHEVVPASGR